MAIISDLRKSIFYLQQVIRNDYPNDKDLLHALDIMVDKQRSPEEKEQLERIKDIKTD